MVPSQDIQLFYEQYYQGKYGSRKVPSAIILVYLNGFFVLLLNLNILLMIDFDNQLEC